MSQVTLPHKRSIDWPIIIIYLSLLIIGWLMLYSTTYDEDSPLSYLDPLSIMGKQSIWIIISVIAFILVVNIEWNFWNTFSYPLYGLSLALLVAVLFVGSEINGAKAWFNLGFFSFQPAEIAKLGTCLALSSYMSFNKYNLNEKRVLFTCLAIIFVPMILILLQPDAGSSLVFLSLTIVLYRKGLSGFYFLFAFALIGIFILSLMYGAELMAIIALLVAYAILLFSYEFKPISIVVYLLTVLAVFYAIFQNYIFVYWIITGLGILISSYLNYSKRNFRIPILVIPSAILAIMFAFLTQFVFDNVLKPHQQERINVWLRPERCDPRGSLYNIIQSKLAIGSGGITGKGFLKGEMTMLKFVPEQTTDFIFTTVGEEQGFIGSVSVVILFLILLYRMVVIAERTRLEFIRNFCYGAAGIFFMHFFVNIGMTVGLMPVIGIPLPFLSKGGSSLLTFSIIIAMVVKMDALRMRG